MLEERSFRSFVGLHEKFHCARVIQVASVGKRYADSIKVHRYPMRPLGYLYKRVEPKPEWLSAPQVIDVYSLSSCVSKNFTDYVTYWKHNGFWLFDSPSVMEKIATENSIPLDGMTLFYYEAYEQEFDDDVHEWSGFEPEPTFGLNVVEPLFKRLEGFDVTSFTNHTSPECSPLSCNSCAKSLHTNSRCLFGTFEDARRAIENQEFQGCEPGPYRIIAIYSVQRN